MPDISGLGRVKFFTCAGRRRNEFSSVRPALSFSPYSLFPSIGSNSRLSAAGRSRKLMTLRTVLFAPEKPRIPNRPPLSTARWTYWTDSPAHSTSIGRIQQSQPRTDTGTHIRKIQTGIPPFLPENTTRRIVRLQEKQDILERFSLHRIQSNIVPAKEYGVFPSIFSGMSVHSDPGFQGAAYCGTRRSMRLGHPMIFPG